MLFTAPTVPAVSVVACRQLTLSSSRACLLFGSAASTSRKSARAPRRSPLCMRAVPLRSSALTRSAGASPAADRARLQSASAASKLHTEQQNNGLSRRQPAQRCVCTSCPCAFVAKAGVAQTSLAMALSDACFKLHACSALTCNTRHCSRRTLHAERQPPQVQETQEKPSPVARQHVCFEACAAACILETCRLFGRMDTDHQRALV